MPHFNAIPAPKLTEEQWTAIHQHDEREWQEWQEKHPTHYSHLHTGTEEEKRWKFMLYVEKQTKLSTVDETKDRLYVMIEKIENLLGDKVNI